jgi:hypothetical protein
MFFSNDMLDVVTTSHNMEGPIFFVFLNQGFQFFAAPISVFFFRSCAFGSDRCPKNIIIECLDLVLVVKFASIGGKNHSKCVCG